MSVTIEIVASGRGKTPSLFLAPALAAIVGADGRTVERVTVNGQPIRLEEVRAEIERRVARILARKGFGRRRRLTKPR